METELRKCLYCGGSAKVKGNTKHRVVCTSCGAMSGEYNLPSLAIRAWNGSKTCSTCSNYHKEARWCDIHSIFLDDNGAPTIEETGRWTAFESCDFCSKWE